MINEYFDLLEDWKLLPAYKLEMRIDSLVGFVLAEISSEIFEVETKVLVPELPLRKGTLYPKFDKTVSANRSYKVDFYIRGMEGENLFIEFKSDSGSIREDQDEYLQISRKRKMKKIVQGILKLWGKTRQKAKYNHLLEKLIEGGLIDESNSLLIEDEEIQIKYIKPSTSIDDEPSEVVNFKLLAESIRRVYKTDDFLRRFADSLEAWGSD